MDEKIKALELLMKHQTGEDFVMEAKHTLAVEILKITVEEFTGKRRLRIDIDDKTDIRWRHNS